MATKVLVIDDEPAILDALGIVLEHAGYEVETIAEYQSYLNKAKELPDLIILDILLMDEDGRRISQELKKSPKTMHIPIIMISAHPGANTTARKAGADAFLAKPFKTEKLLETIKRLV